MERYGIGFGLFFVLAAVACGDSESDGAGGSGGQAGSGANAGSAGAGGSAGGAGVAGSSGSAGTAGTAGSAGAGGGGTEWDAYCAAAVTQHTNCGSSFDCVASACIYSAYEADLVDDYANCLLQRSCGELGSDDDCFSETGLENGELPPTSKARVDACLDKVNECPGELDMDACSVFAPLISETHAAAAELCLQKPCGEVGGCFGTVLSAFDCFDDAGSSAGGG